MKILVFSDTHLDLPFEEKKFKLINRIITDSDRVIIAGDFWEGYQIKFDQFIHSPWKSLFPLLKSRNTIYIYGNHDKKILSDELVSLFSTIQTHQYKLKVDGKIFIVEHGNRLSPFFDDILHLKRPPFFLTKQVKKVSQFLLKKYKKKFTRFAYSRFNKTIKRRIKKEFKDNQIIVCGHTHFAEFDLSNQFINTGFIRFGLAQYLVIESQKITPKEEWYE